MRSANLRKAVFAGSWYPSSAAECEREIAGFLEILSDPERLKHVIREELQAIVGSFCPNILFPYARESIASLVQKGGFPEFVLQPINFDALYMESKQQQMAAAAGDSETH